MPIGVEHGINDLEQRSKFISDFQKTIEENKKEIKTHISKAAIYKNNPLEFIAEVGALIAQNELLKSDGKNIEKEIHPNIMKLYTQLKGPMYGNNDGESRGNRNGSDGNPQQSGSGLNSVSGRDSGKTTGRDDRKGNIGESGSGSTSNAETIRPNQKSIDQKLQEIKESAKPKLTLESESKTLAEKKNQASSDQKNLFGKKPSKERKTKIQKSLEHIKKNLKENSEKKVESESKRLEENKNQFSNSFKMTPAEKIKTKSQYTSKDHYDRPVIDGIKQSIMASGYDASKPITIDEDGFVVDGHHRFTAVSELVNEGKIPKDTPIATVTNETILDANRR